MPTWPPTLTFTQGGLFLRRETSNPFDSLLDGLQES